jgi:hypothetical protein
LAIILRSSIVRRHARDKFLAARAFVRRGGEDTSLSLRTLRDRSPRLCALRSRADLLRRRLPHDPSAGVEAAFGSDVPALTAGRAQARGTAARVASHGQIVCAESDASRIPYAASKRHRHDVGARRGCARQDGGARWRCGRRRCG